MHGNREDLLLRVDRRVGEMHQMCRPLIVKLITSGEMSLNKAHLLGSKPCCLLEMSRVCGARSLMTSTLCLIVQTFSHSSESSLCSLTLRGQKSRKPRLAGDGKEAGKDERSHG